MKTKHGWIAAAAGVMAIAAAMTGIQHAQDMRLAPLPKIKITGSVSVQRDSGGGWIVSPWVSITRDGEPLGGLDVRLEDIPLRESFAGNYVGGRMTEITPVAGDTLNLAIASRPHLPTERGRRLAISCSARIGSLVQITAPAPGSSFVLSSLGTTLAVSWTGGTPPFELYLGRRAGAAPRVFSQSGLMDSSFVLPGTLFAAGNSYLLCISFGMNSFLIKCKDRDPGFKLDRSSEIKLRCADYSEFSMN